MAEVDTSSYPKAGLPVNMLDVASKIGGMEQQKLAIDQAKLDQANQGLQYMTRAMGALGPDATKEQYIGAAQSAVQMGLVPANTLNVFKQRIMAAPTSQAAYNDFMTTAASHDQQIKYHLGQREDVSNGQQVTPSVSSVKPGFGVRPIALPIQQQAPPTAQTVDENNQPRLLGAQPSQLPPGARPAGNLPGQYRMPVERPEQRVPPAVAGPITDPAIKGQSANFGGRVVGATVEPTTFAQRFDSAFPQARGAAAGATPMFEEGKKAYAAAQANAGIRSQAIKPAIQALKLMPGLATGPGTGQFNDLVAAAKAWGIVDTKAENDPTVLRQELEKKLAQYVGGSPIGQRSDAQQALAEAGSPNPKKQILPALQSLTRDAIALERVQILLPQAFKGNDYQNFVKHQGTFPQSVDEKALTLDMLPEAERNKLVNKMANQYRDGNAGEKKIANRFLDTLKLAKQHSVYEGM